MRYYNIVQNQIKLTEEGQKALSVLGISLNELIDYPDEKLNREYWQGCKTFIDQALQNGKGITWLDDGRIPYENKKDKKITLQKNQGNALINRDKLYGGYGDLEHNWQGNGRFPANLCCSSGIDVNIEALLEAKRIIFKILP